MAKFEILKRSPRPNVSLKSPVANALRGIAFQESATPNVAELADGTISFQGFVTRPVKIGGPDLGDSIYPNRIELPFTAGEEMSLELAEEFVAEGADYLYSGTGMITSGTSLKSQCGFKDGKIRVAQGSEIKEFTLVELMTPETEGNVRARFRVNSGR